MTISIEMTEELPNQHGQYYVLSKNQAERFNPQLGHLSQGHGDYFPVFSFGGKSFVLDKLKGQFYFSKEPIQIRFVKQQGILERELTTI